tara:strand:- start:306 stop:800 length:495 start_codon:yes stop_codon:yes gene_type:complete
MKKPDLQYLGEFIKLFSFKGEIILYSEASSNTIDNIESIFVEIDKSYIPYEIFRIKSHKKNIYRIRLKNVSTESEANTFLKKKVFIQKTKNSISNNFVDNFEIYNNNEFVGVVISTINKTGQTIIEVKMSKKNVLIPLADELITEISHEEKKINMILPEGLLDI